MSEPRRRHRAPARPARSALLAALVVLAAAGCGSSQGGDYGGAHPDYAKALAGSPPPLAALHRQANQLLGGGTDAYEKRIAALRGYPAVVNVWASWCGPCRFEFPHFQQAAAEYGKRVAFLGIDKQDSADAAATFLREAPVPYPSYEDPDEEIADSLGASLGLPDTAFYDRRGKLVYLKQGPYDDLAELRADVERYALGGGGTEGG
jgi:cytochrome c biogenesis protein CcmG/thiol:disulfide interchange protein DsbE